MSNNLARVPIFMSDLADIAARVLVDELGLDAERAGEIGMRISREGCAEHAGEILYIPAGQALNIDERDRAMHAFYVSNGKDINAVAHEFKVVVQTAYKRIRLVEAMLYAERQGGLFEPAEADK